MTMLRFILEQIRMDDVNGLQVSQPVIMELFWSFRYFVMFWTNKIPGSGHTIDFGMEISGRYLNQQEP